MPMWLYLATGIIILAVFLLFLSKMIKERVSAIILMFVFTLLASAALSYGVYNAYLESRENLGKPIQSVEEADYEVFWIAQNTDDNKIYFVANKIEEPPKADVRLYAIDPSNEFIKRLKELLEEKQKLTLKMKKNEKGLMEPSLHPRPPQGPPPKNEP